jgi:protein-disulfide isomerase
MKRETWILGSIIVAVVVVMVALFAFANKGTPAPVGNKDSIVRADSHQTGSGKVQLVEFGDFQCPACGNAEPNVEQILKDFNGKVTFYFRNFPLVDIHPNAQAGAEAAEAAADQGKYWEMHNLLYAKQNDWAELGDPQPKFIEYATALGLNVDKFRTAIQNHQFKSKVDQDEADANAMGLNQTPTFYLNGVQHTDFSSYAVMRDAINAELAKQ